MDFAIYWLGMQQDVKLAVIPPLLCALFRLIFIKAFAPDKRYRGNEAKWRTCFSYAFWWGMDWNAYQYLWSLILATLPAALFADCAPFADGVRTVWLLAWALALYAAFIGKMIFWYHFHDTYNHMLFLGGKANKANLLDIFFHENHGALVLLAALPYLLMCYGAARLLLSLPTLAYPPVQGLARYLLDFAVFALSIGVFYWFHYGGTFRHRQKPEWDEIPHIVKFDLFFAKACMDDFIALQLVLRNRAQRTVMRHSDEQSQAIIGRLSVSSCQSPVERFPSALARGAGSYDPLRFFRRVAKGPLIAKPSRIFVLFAESHAQQCFDPWRAPFTSLMEGTGELRRDRHTVAINNFLPAGPRSRPAMNGLLTGVFDLELELNEQPPFQRAHTVTSLAWQLRELGYRARFWYGCELGHGGIEAYAPAVGFHEARGGTDICGKDAPRTWLGVHDHIFLERSAAAILREDDTAPTFDFLYTTSMHGPYLLPVDEYGFDLDRLLAEASPELRRRIRQNPIVYRRLGVAWYADQALAKFAATMLEAFPDSLVIITGDHSSGVVPLDLTDAPWTLRDGLLTSFAMHHRGLTPDMLAGNAIGSHMHIPATLMELIAPKGFTYYSLMPPMTEPLDHVVTHDGWLTAGTIGKFADMTVQPLTPNMPPPSLPGDAFLAERDAYCEITPYLLRHPELLTRS